MVSVTPISEKVRQRAVEAQQSKLNRAKNEGLYNLIKVGQIWRMKDHFKLDRKVLSKAPNIKNGLLRLERMGTGTTSVMHYSTLLEEYELMPTPKKHPTAK